MTPKVITKRMHDALDSFISQNHPENTQNDNFVEEVKNSKRVRKQDGLIEKLDNKIFVADDNRELLRG